jgi:putative NADH-flavin reductase
MNLLILGATGSTGRHILDLGVARGHRLTALCRSPGKIRRDDVHIVQGNPLDFADLVRVLPGHDAVLSALGPRIPEAFRPHELLGPAAASTVAAMRSTGVQRLLVVSAAVLFPMNGLRFAFFRWLLQQHIRDLREMESVIQGAPLDWTIARPPRLVDKPEERYRSERDMLPAKGFTMTFRAVAAFLLDALEAGSHTREIVGLAA